MTHVINLIRRYLAMALALIMALIPFSGSVKNEKDDSVLLKAAVVSDVHIDRRFPIGQLALKNFCRDALSLSPDAAVVLGDLTNYGDKATLERYFEITTDAFGSSVQSVVISGNHDIGHAKEADGGRMNPEALADFVSFCNEYLDYGIEFPYYTRVVNGYAFICLNDESADNWDSPEYSEAALQFLADELNAYADRGKPVFVLIHVPLSGIHGEQNFYEGGGTEEPWNGKIKKTLEQHSNVFCLSGHLHKALSKNQDTPTYNCVNGVHYLNLPSYLMPNWPVGLAVNGLGYIMEVRETAVTFRCRSYYMHNWLDNYDYEISLEPASADTNEPAAADPVPAEEPAVPAADPVPAEEPAQETSTPVSESIVIAAEPCEEAVQVK